jgi:hypothetical protein
LTFPAILSTHGRPPRSLVTLIPQRGTGRQLNRQIAEPRSDLRGDHPLPEALKKVRTEITSVVHSLPWLIARDEGLFQNEGLLAELHRAPDRGVWRRTAGTGDQTIAGTDLVEDHDAVDSMGVHLVFEEGVVELYRA